MGEPQVGQLYSVGRKILGPLCSAFYRIRVEGLENVPDTGPAILCPNHISFLDSPFLMNSLPRQITFVGKAEYMDDWKTKFLFPAMGMIPIDRSGGKASDAALDAATGVLEGGGLFGIFPEGTRSRNGVLHRGHTGPARLALQTGAPIIPVGIIGTDKIQPPDASMPGLLKACAIRFAKPLDVERYRDRADDRLVLRQIIDEVMFDIRSMTGQDYVDQYANKKPDAYEAAPTAVVPSSNGRGDAAEKPRRSSADVLARH